MRNRRGYNIGKMFCLNPYSTGRYSMSLNTLREYLRQLEGLNPYSTGRYSMRILKLIDEISREVLILILLEDTL